MGGGKKDGFVEDKLVKFQRKETDESCTNKAAFNVLNKRTPGIESMLPYMLCLMIKFLEMWMGKSGEKYEPTGRGIQRGQSSHILHENLMVDPRIDFRAPATTKNVDINSKVQDQQADPLDKLQEGQFQAEIYVMDKVKTDEEIGVSIDHTQIANHSAHNHSGSPQLLNNKATLTLSKKKRDALKKKQISKEKKRSWE